MLEALAPGARGTLEVRFTPVAALARVGCAAPIGASASGRLLVRAAGLSDEATLRGSATAHHDAAGCAQVPRVVSVGGGEGLSEDDDLGATFVPTRAGRYTFGARAVIDIKDATHYCECPYATVTTDVDPLDGFAARVRWSHAGATVPDPTADARVELHVARVDPFPDGAPPWSSSAWDAWPGSGTRVFDGAEVNVWPAEGTRVDGRAEFLQAGQALAIGVKSLTWSASPGEVAPVDASATLEVWMRGEVAYTASLTLAPGTLDDVVHIVWDPPGDALFGITVPD